MTSPWPLPEDWPYSDYVRPATHRRGPGAFHPNFGAPPDRIPVDDATESPTEPEPDQSDEQ